MDPATRPDLDLDAIEADLDAIERALAQLDDGSYWAGPEPDQAAE